MGGVDDDCFHVGKNPSLVLAGCRAALDSGPEQYRESQSMNIQHLFGLDGKRALITGSSKGIGFALARGLGHAGAEVVLNGRGADTLEAACTELASQGIKATFQAFDVTSPDAVRDGVDAIEAQQGPIDILINNAGMQYRSPLEDFPDEAWSTLMRTNLDSVFNVGKAVARHMIARGQGKIINICSVQTALARPGIAPYTASKGAVANLTKGMCTDWAKHGLQVNGLAPGYFETELTEALVKDETFSAWLANRTPAGRWGKVDELVGAAVFLASPSASFVNGHILYVDGGITACL
jgi:gluconate 5-dehydrogenase